MKSRIKSLIDNTSERTLVIIMMLISVVFWSSISGYLKIQRYHADEWCYLQKAYALKNGYGLDAIYGIPGLGSEYERYVYSILIAPACFITDIGLRFKMIALINAISLSSSAVPVYLFSKELLKERRNRLLVVVISLTMPYMNYCASFMSDNIMIPIGLWLIYLNYMLIKFKDFSKRNNIQRIVVTVVFLFLAWNTKNTGRVFLYAEAITFLLAVIYYKAERLGNNKKRLLLFLACIGLALGLCINFVLLYKGDNGILRSASGQFLKLYQIVNYDNQLFGDSILYVFISFVLAVCIIPFVLYFFSIGKLELSDKVFGVWYWVITLLLITEVVRASYSRYNLAYNGFYEGFTQIWFRYVTFLYMPLIICFFKAAERIEIIKIKYVFVLSISLLIFWLLLVFFYKGAQAENAATYSMLYWVRNYGNKVDIHIIKSIYLLIIACIIGLFIYIYTNCPRKIITLFLLIWFPIQGFNNVMCHSTFASENSLKGTGMLELRGFVLEHLDDDFLLVELDDGHINSESLFRGDAYLDTKNIVRYNPDILRLADFPCDLNSYYTEEAPEIDTSQVKYLLLTSKLEASDNDDVIDLKIGDNQWYTLYKLKSIGNLPCVQLVRE